MTNRLDLPIRYRNKLEALLREHVPDVEVWAYGSRVNGRSHEASDLDLVLRSATLEPVAEGFSDLLEAIENSNIPILIQAHDWARLPESFHPEIERNYIVVQKGAIEPTARSDWRRVSLAEVTDLILSSVDKKTKYDERPIQLCNYMDVYKNSFIHAGMGFMTATATEQEISKCSLNVGDVVITKDSEKYDDIGVPALMREEVPNLVCGYHLAILRACASDVDGTYLFYALSADKSQQQFHAYANGVTRFGLRKADIGLVRIPLPPLEEQRVIAYVLRALDDKIELNRRMNETLETMARALFKSWFVDFDPVRAKMEGRDPGLPKHLSDLFPDRLMDSELGEIPAGWEVRPFAEMIQIIGGGTPKTSVPEYWDGDIPWFSVGDAPAHSDVWVIDTVRKCSRMGIQNSSARILTVGTTIISARGTVGRVALVGVPMAMNQSCYGLRFKESTSPIFSYFTIRALVATLKQRTHGSVFNTITRDTLKEISIVTPSQGAIEVYENLVRPALEQIRVRLFESRTLATLRDILLPKLISGELRVNAADYFSSDTN